MYISLTRKVVEIKHVCVHNKDLDTGKLNNIIMNCRVFYDISALKKISMFKFCAFVFI